jgi:hypothetical protein
MTKVDRIYRESNALKLPILVSILDLERMFLLLVAQRAGAEKSGASREAR